MGYPVGIVSGLALGIDTIAHETALAVGLPTFAFPGSGLNPSVLYPRTNLHLAEKSSHREVDSFQNLHQTSKQLSGVFRNAID